MKKLNKNINVFKGFVDAHKSTAVLLLCSLGIAGCGDALTPKPFVFDMTRINQDGSVNDGKDYATKPWACVQDNQSGLIWEVKTIEAGLQNIDNTYSWYDSDQMTNGGWAGKVNGGVCSGSACDTESYIKTFNAKKLCGYADWYLPSRYELNTIVDTSVFYPGPTLPSAYFPESKAGSYWTDTTFKTRRASAWVWRFDHGSDYVEEKSAALKVRLTRPAAKPVAK
ncbi:MAG: DUF1566 domain-containing protein [Sideroxydans sp.]|jgi:hypothetical protein